MSCNAIYDEAVGDPDNGVAPGTSIGSLPADWTCQDSAARRTSRLTRSLARARRRYRCVLEPIIRERVTKSERYSRPTSGPHVP